jgi:hypothetical protein
LIRKEVLLAHQGYLNYMIDSFGLESYILLNNTDLKTAVGAQAADALDAV